MRWIAPLAFVVLLAGCASFGSTRISQLQNNPARYSDKTVTVAGTVTSSWGLPLVPFKAYRVNDGTGDITVLSQRSVTPTTGAKVRVRGKVSQIGMLGGRSLGLHLTEENIKVGR